jgi:PGF-pre-PGF domain-containing protein
LDETPISVTNPSGTSGTVSLDSLSNGRTYYYIIEACDADTHTLCANTSQASFTTNHASSSGGGGGGGGSSSSTPASSNAFYATTFDQVLSGSTNLTLTSIVIAFNQLTITTNVNTANVKFTVQALADSPHAYTMPVFQYLEVNHTNLDDSSINGVKIKFTVPKSWLTSNNIASSDVRLVRYYNGIWTPLSTTKQSEDTTNVYYQADSPGLSLYAISTQSAQQSAPVVNTTNTTNTTAVVTPTTPTPTTPTTPEATPTTPTSASGSNAWIIIVIIVVVAIAAIVIFIVYKKKKV